MNSSSNPLVSVGMTTYNNPEGLEGAIKSIINQTYKNLEIIISDDCSPLQKTKDVINNYVSIDKRIKYIRQEKNLGPPKNINFVLTQATGEYFMWADDDDFRDSRWIEVLLPKLNNSNVIATLGSVVAINESGKPTQICRPIQFSGCKLKRLAAYYLAEESSGKACITCGLFNTDFLRKIKHWSQYKINKHGYGDHYFNFDCLQHGDVITDLSVTIYKKTSINNIENNINVKNLDIIRSALRRIKYYAGYICVPTKFLDKVVVLLLFPLKCVKSFLFYITTKCRFVA